MKLLTSTAIFVKSFSARITFSAPISVLNPPSLREFLKASGQYMSYSKIIRKNEPIRLLYVAMPTFVYYRLIKYDWVVEVMTDLNMKIILYNSEKEIIEEWKE